MSASFKIDPLKKDNWETWKLQMEAILIKNDAWEYVSGTLKKPSLIPDNDESIKEIKAWEIKDSKARSDLILSIDPTELKQIKYCLSSHEVWKKLETIHQSSGPAKKAFLLKKLMLSKMKDGENIIEYLNNFFETVDKLKEMNLEINEDLLTIIMLYSLPEKFENFRIAIETRDDLPKPEVLRIKILEEYEAREERENKQIEGNVLYVNKPKTFKKGYFQKPNENKFKNEAFKVKCHICGKIGHKSIDCYFNQKKKVFKQSNNSTLYIKESEAMINEEEKKKQIWCLDSGCTSHMTGEKESFDKIYKTSKELKLANNQKTSVEGIGKIKINVKNNFSIDQVRLENTLYVPNLRTNLLSVAKITDHGYNVKFTKNKAFIINKRNRKVLGIADRKGDLYFIEKEEETNLIKDGSKIQDWHYKLGHLNQKSLQEVLKKTKILNFNEKSKLEPCEWCIVGKHVQTKFPSSTKVRTNQPLQIIHTDVCGPMRTESNGGKKYFVIFVDDYTRYTEVYFIRNKNEVIDIFKMYKAQVENNTGYKIKNLQSDNGTEYCNKKFDEFLWKHGIKRRFTVPYTPQQNGIAERKIRSLVETARCNLLQSNLPPSFWAEAINTANYIRNRCPSNGINGEIPYEKWTNSKLNLKHLEIFGSPVYVLNKTPNKNKFEPRSIRGIFVGYSDTAKAYRIYIPNKRNVIFSRDVKFLKRENVNIEDFLLKQEKKQTQEILVEFPIISENMNQEKIENTPLHLELNPEDSINLNQNEKCEKETTEKEVELKRGRGRPKLEKTGKKGRPRKIYKMKIENEPDEDDDTNLEANIGEISLKEALKEDEKDWKKAIRNEITALIKNKTWELVEKPRNKNIIGCKLILKKKFKQDGSLEKWKARIVAKGFTQKEGIDFHETYSPVTRLSSIRKLIAIAVEHNMHIHQMDVITAYLNGEINEEIYMKTPDLFKETLEEIIKNKEVKEEILRESTKMLKEMENGNKVCKLKKALYGLKQAGLQWYKKLDNKLKEIGIKPINADQCIYTSNEEEPLLVAIYVDDIIIACKNLKKIENFKKKLFQNFEMKDLGKIHYCIGLEFSHVQIEGENTVKISQKKYIKEILQRFGMEDSKPVSTPMDPNSNLEKPKVKNEEIMKKYPYQNLIGSLMYVSIGTRPDITFSVNFLSQFNTNYNESHWIAAKRVLRYLKGTINLELTYRTSGKEIECYTDADWGSSIDDRRSYTGYLFKMANAATSWETKKQRTVALSSTEAEYMSLTEAAKEALYEKKFLSELKFDSEKPIIIYNDNQSCQKLAKNNVYHSRTKHIDIKYHFIRKALEDNIINLKYCQTEEMIADMLTKPLTKPKLQKFITMIGLEGEC